MTTSVRRIRPLLLALLLPLAAALPAAAQTADPDGCAGPDSHHFDFWPGTWEVESRLASPDGSWHETTQRWTAREVMGGCVFLDEVEGDFGRGLVRGWGSRWFDARTEEWVITWMSTDAPGRMGMWRGAFDADGRGEFIQENETPQGLLLSRISWYDLTDDSAGWDHAVSTDGGETWRVTWEMRFQRADEAPDPMP